MKIDLKKISLIITIIIGLSGLIGGGYTWISCNVVSASEFKNHDLENQYQFLNIKLDKLEDRIFNYEERLFKRPNDHGLLSELDKIKEEKKRVIEQITEIEKIKLQKGK